MEEENDWPAEADAVIRDVQEHVKCIHVVKKLSSSKGTYLNITTIEGRDFCIMLGPSGFQVVGNGHNDISLENSNQIFYETPYALLSTISPSYYKSFGNLLVKKLNDLENVSE